MAFSSAAVTLDQYAAQSNDPLVQKFTDSLYKTGNVLKDIPLATKQTLIMLGARMDDKSSLPSMTNVWTAVNQDPTVVSGKLTNYNERMFLVRALIQIDVAINREPNAIAPPIDVQSDLFWSAFEYHVNNIFINNAHNASGNLDAVVGLRSRLDNASTYGVISENLIDGGGIDISKGGISAANANAFLEFVDQLLDYLMAPEGDDVVLYMNDFMKRRMAAAIRQLAPGGGFTSTKDAFDRPVTMYRNARIRDIGRKADQTTRIISQSETVGGADGGTVYTSIYGVKYGANTFAGWQPKALTLTPLGLDPTVGTRYNWLVDWGWGMWIPHNRSFGRIFGIKIA